MPQLSRDKSQNEVLLRPPVTRPISEVGSPDYIAKSQREDSDIPNHRLMLDSGLLPRGVQEGGGREAHWAPQLVSRNFRCCKIRVHCCVFFRRVSSSCFQTWSHCHIGDTWNILLGDDFFDFWSIFPTPRVVSRWYLSQKNILKQFFLVLDSEPLSVLILWHLVICCLPFGILSIFLHGFWEGG